MSPELHDALRSNALFEGIRSERLEEIIRTMEVVEFPANRVIFEENDPGDYTYLIVSGEVRISKRRGKGSGKDPQEVLAYLREGDFFGEMAVFDPAPRSARAVAVQACRLGRMDREGLEILGRMDPVQFARNLTCGVIRRLREANDRHVEEMLQTERLSTTGMMASAIVHDLRSPLNDILSAAELLRLGIGADQTARWVGIIKRKGSRMVELAEDLLDMSDRGEISLSPSVLPVDELLDELRVEKLEALQRKGYEIRERIGYRGPVEVDSSRLRRVLVNMLNNAADVMPLGGAVTLTIDRLADWLHISVLDEGPGIAEEVIGRIFEPFFTHGKAGGTGLGMWISQAIVEAHGGAIDVENHPSGGARFTIRIPQPLPRKAGEQARS